VACGGCASELTGIAACVAATARVESTALLGGSEEAAASKVGAAGTAAAAAAAALSATGFAAEVLRAFAGLVAGFLLFCSVDAVGSGAAAAASAVAAACFFCVRAFFRGRNRAVKSPLFSSGQSAGPSD